jgi:hypothetical protein
MYVRGYLQGSENGRVATIGICLSFLYACIDVRDPIIKRGTQNMFLISTTLS